MLYERPIPTWFKSDSYLRKPSHTYYWMFHLCTFSRKSPRDRGETRLRVWTRPQQSTGPVRPCRLIAVVLNQRAWISWRRPRSVRDRGWEFNSLWQTCKNGDERNVRYCYQRMAFATLHACVCTNISTRSYVRTRTRTDEERTRFMLNVRWINNDHVMTGWSDVLIVSELWPILGRDRSI